MLILGTTSWSVPTYWNGNWNGDWHGGRTNSLAQVSEQSLNRFQRIR